MFWKELMPYSFTFGTLSDIHAIFICLSPSVFIINAHLPQP